MELEKIERPALGKLKVGDPVIVIKRTNGRSSEHPATVVKVGRAWVTVRPDSRSPEIRMRLDSQSEETGYGYGGRRFATPEQRAYDDRMAAARQTLTDAGVRFDHHSPFRHDDAATLALAERVAEIVDALKVRDGS